MDSEWTVNGQCLHRPVGLMYTNFAHFLPHLGSNSAQLGPIAVCSSIWWSQLRSCVAVPDHFGIMLMMPFGGGGVTAGRRLGEGRVGRASDRGYRGGGEGGGQLKLMIEGRNQI